MAKVVDYGESRLEDVDGQDTAIIKTHVAVEVPVFMRLHIQDEEAEVINEQAKKKLCEEVINAIESSSEFVEHLHETYAENLADMREYEREMRREKLMDNMDRAREMNDVLKTLT